MPPSTVFSYLRRDHRRPSSPATSTHPTAHSSSTALPGSNISNQLLPPQIPLPSPSAYSPRLPDTIVGSTPLFEPLQRQQQQLLQQSGSDYNNFTHYNNHGGKAEHVPDSRRKQDSSTAGRDNISTIFPLSASPQIIIPPPNPDRIRPHSAGSDKWKKASVSADSQHQTTMIRPDQHDGNVYSSKPTSPWKLTFGKNILSDSSKGSSSGGASAGGYIYSQGSTYNNSTRSRPSPPGYVESNSNINTFSGGREYFKHESSSSGSSFRRDTSSHDAAYEPAHPLYQRGKTRLNLLNPMALLARRRSARALALRPEDIGTGRLALPALPDDYDPRIRGKLFHDFSAPRPRPGVPVKTPQPLTQPPVVNLQDAHNDKVAPPVPVLKEGVGFVKQESQVNDERSFPEIGSSYRPPSPDRSHPIGQVHDKPLPLRQTSVEVQKDKRASRSSGVRSSSARSKVSMVHDGSFQPSGLPRHLTSSASRFSFDLAGGDSASQERLMEERHKEKEAAKRAKAQLDQTYDSDSDDFDYDAMMDDGMFEERIPGVNVDANLGGEFDDFSGQGHVLRVLGNNNLFVPVLPTLLSSPMSALDLNSSAPCSPEQEMPAPLMINPNNTFAGLAASVTILQNGSGANMMPIKSLSPQEISPQAPFDLGDDEDELYFDDGLIDDIGGEIENGEKFDESVFDDENSHLYERKAEFIIALPSVPDEDNVQNDAQEGAAVAEGGGGGGEEEAEGESDAVNVPLVAQNSVLQRNISSQSGGINRKSRDINRRDMQPSAICGLTEGNLEQYHSALAQAANEAALNGRFERSRSISENSSSDGSISQSAAESRPDLTADDSRISITVDSLAFDDFDYNDDDYLDEDAAIIAAANAEALENDDEGFYGQEFGFYPQAVGDCDEEMVLGGYFGTRGVDGVTRSHSGRVNFQEPSLTPITERSEWSTRNSIVSLTAHPGVMTGAAAPLASPQPLTPLTHLDMGSIDDEMNALLKLRRGAWGGSNGSLRSSAASQAHTTGGSPIMSSACVAAASASSRGSFVNFHDVSSEQRRSSGNGDGNGNTLPAGSPVGVESNNSNSSSSSNNNNNNNMQHFYSLSQCHSHPHRAQQQQQPQHQNYYQVGGDISPATSYNNNRPPQPENGKLLPQTEHSDQHSYPKPQPHPQPYPHPHPHPHPPLSHLHLHRHCQPKTSLNIDTARANISSTTSTLISPSFAKSYSRNINKPHHRRSSSAGESISYVKQTDEAGGDQWVLERRRTGEGGEHEVVEREVMDWGMI
ncbi:hypothetical protein PAAG_02730 [Paracoccidioides lutzii Pb01]|uniref:AGC-kinase C-terminal domain-containing protein n=1 Tax=Paracoccidioides lutzii (strain ATCC MYA-826 / Pb01) TaxID=502779 RepID=C1GW35_PARBA|nr:hypothetical protein PAAG_02730 [Paracoccidioides lutzii Pb01]EEH40754.1 hypothetical protein PAAG_02730 [Paracoccidioides lutzii Pb01]